MDQGKRKLNGRPGVRDRSAGAGPSRFGPVGEGPSVDQSLGLDPSQSGRLDPDAGMAKAPARTAVLDRRMVLVVGDDLVIAGDRSMFELDHEFRVAEADLPQLSRARPLPASPLQPRKDLEAGQRRRQDRRGDDGKAGQTEASQA